MDEAESKEDQQKKKRRFSQERYDMLLRCSGKKDITERNQWRRENPEKLALFYKSK
jgi:hypothetical protein